MDYPEAYLIDFPTKIKARTVKNEDDSYSIFINAKLNQEARLAAYQHEIEHIERGDFNEKSENVQTIEMVAHAIKTAKTTDEPLKNVVDEKWQKQLASLQRQRKKIKRKLKQYREDMEFLNFSDEEKFARAEYQWLYGNDL